MRRTIWQGEESLCSQVVVVVLMVADTMHEVLFGVAIL